MSQSTAILLRLSPDLAAFVAKEAKRKKRSRQAVIYMILAERMINGHKTLTLDKVLGDTK